MDALGGRRSERTISRAPADLVVESESLKAHYTVSTVDVSQHGVRVQAIIPLTPGQIVEISTTTSPRYTARCRVVWVARSGAVQDRQVGLEFLNPPLRM